MTLPEQKRSIGVFPQRSDAEKALAELKAAGFPMDKAHAYSDWLSRGGYLVMVEGSEDDICRAETLLTPGGIQDWLVYK